MLLRAMPATVSVTTTTSPFSAAVASVLHPQWLLERWRRRERQAGALALPPVPCVRIKLVHFVFTFTRGAFFFPEEEPSRHREGRQAQGPTHPDAGQGQADTTGRVR
jgi:hypothetical protein